MTITGKTLSELYRYLQNNGGSYNDLKIIFQNSGIEPNENIAPVSSRNKDIFLDRYIRPLNLSERADSKKLIEFIEQIISFPPSPNAFALVECLKQDGWQVVGNRLIQSGHDVDAIIQSMLYGQPIDTIQREWERAILAISNDPADALTAASSMVEATFKFILHDSGVQVPANQDIQSLSKVTFSLLDVSPGKETDADFRTLFQSTISIVHSIGAIRTKIGDAHGAPPSRKEPTEKHSRLAVNIAGAVSLFLIETYIDKKSKVKAY